MPLLGRLGIPERELQEAGYGVLKHGERGMAALAGEVAAHAPADTFGAKGLFGWAYTGFSFKQALSRRLRVVMSDVAADLGRKGRKYVEGIRPEARRLTTYEIARIHDLHQPAVANVADAMGLLLPHDGKKGTPYMVAREDVDLLVATLEQVMTRATAASALGLDAVPFAKLAVAGFLPKLATRWHEGTGEDRFHLGDYIGFLETVPCEVVEWNPAPEGEDDRYMPLGDALTATGYDPASLMRDIFAGTFKVDGLAWPRLGLNAFLVEPGVGDLGHPFMKRLLSPVATRTNRAVFEGMSQREACAMLDVPPPTVLRLTELGHLPIVDSMVRKNRQKLDRDGVVGFAAEYAAGKLYAGVLGVQSSKVRTTLSGRGIRDLFQLDGLGADEVARLAPFYRRSELRTHLDLPRDPDEDDARRAYWKRFATILGKHRTGFGVWSIPLDGPPLCATSDRFWPIRLDLGRSLDQPPWSGTRTPATYVIEATMRIEGEDGRKRMGELSAALAGRRLMKGIRHVCDGRAGSLVAALSTKVVVRRDPTTSEGEATDALERVEAGLMERMLLTLKGSFETATRSYDHRCFGAWPHEIEVVA